MGAACSCVRSQTRTDGSSGRGHWSGSTRNRRTVEDCMKHARQCLLLLTTDQEAREEDVQSIFQLSAISEQGVQGWVLVNLTFTVLCRVDDHLATALLDILMDSISLPTPEAISCLQQKLPLSRAKFESTRESVKYGICLLLGHLAERLAGHLSNRLMSDDVLGFIISTLKEPGHPLTHISAIVALEKFSQTKTNKKKILDQNFHVLLQKIETSFPNASLLSAEYQLAFCAQWSLDNYFPLEGRPPTYQSLQSQLEGVNVMLNHDDVSEFLKISADGHEARNDAASFESVRSTACVLSEGAWYYEVMLLTEGIMQIGWATLDSTFQNHEGAGIGDDEYSFAFDCQRALLWHKGRSTSLNTNRRWQTGDVVGCLVTFAGAGPKHLRFSLNGNFLPGVAFTTNLSDLYAAGSFSCSQHVRFNFGEEPFQFPPHSNLKTLHQHGAPLGRASKIVTPWCAKQQLMREVHFEKDACQICFDKPAMTKLTPCHHSGFCRACASQFERCPICRSDIASRVAMTRRQSSKDIDFSLSIGSCGKANEFTPLTSE